MSEDQNYRLALVFFGILKPTYITTLVSMWGIELYFFWMPLSKYPDPAHSAMPLTATAKSKQRSQGSWGL